MALLRFDNVGIAALAGALPDHVQKIDLDPAHPHAAYIAHFVKQTGVRQRHVSISEQTATDYGCCALRAALDRAGWEAQSLDGLIFMSQTPDFNPATGNAFVVHKQMGLRPETPVFDLTLACSSFPYGLSVCASFLQQPHIRRMAMLSGDTLWPTYPSREALLADHAFLGGEGSIALLLEKKPASPGEVLDIALYSDGSGYHFLYNPWGGARHAWRRVRGRMPNGEIYAGGGNYMDGLEITSFATLRVVDSMKNFLAQLDKSVDDYDGLVLHQANRQIVSTMARRLKVGMDKVPTTLDRLGNTNGASVALTMIDAYAGAQNGPLNLLLSAFGTGLSWGVAGLRLDPAVIVPMLTCAERFEDAFLKPVDAASV